MTHQLDHAYRLSRDAMLECLAEGSVDAAGLREMQNAMANLAPSRVAFGAARFDELRGLLDQVEALPPHRGVGQAVQEPMFGHEHQRQMQPYRWVPYPYRLSHWDPAWVLVAFLVAFGFVFEPLWLLAGFIAFMRALVWCSMRFPLTTVFFVSLFNGLLGGGRRRW